MCPLICVPRIIFFIAISSCAHSQDWRTADRSSAVLAPLPKDEPAAIVQVYTGRAYGWRKYFAVHSWIAIKEKNGETYVTYQVTGFSLRRGGSSVEVRNDLPDRRWFGAEPDLIFEMKGEQAERAIPVIKNLATAYVYANDYVLYPGPNSNTFISHIIRHTPGMGVELPPTAIGKDWIDDGDFFGWTEAGTGVQVSIFGLLGLAVGLREGLEINLFGMVFGFDILRPALKLPLIGRVGFRDSAVFN